MLETVFDPSQHAGPKLSGYPTTTATRAAVIQNPAVENGAKFQKFHHSSRGVPGA